MSQIQLLFGDDLLIRRIRERFPRLFFLAEVDASRAGKQGMEVGSVRERIIIAMLMHKFGPENVKTDGITTSEIDVILYGRPISIKTISGQRINGIKAVWTVDPIKAREFVANYVPRYDMILVQVNWGGVGIFALIPHKAQKEVFEKMGRNAYFKLPKEGTNPRGVEFSKEAMSKLTTHAHTMKIEIDWIRPNEQYNEYQRWLGYWSEN